MCADCSIQLYVPGVHVGKRICNRCENDWTNQIQSDSTKSNGGGGKFGKFHPALESLSVDPQESPLLPTLSSYLPYSNPFKAADPSLRPACGRITVTVLSALSLPSTDANGKADPYCRITMTGYSRNPLKPKLIQEWRKDSRFELETHYVSATLCPVWRGATVTLPVIRTCGGTLRIAVHDYDAIGKHEVLGMCEVPLEDLPNVYDPGGGPAAFEVDNW